MSNIPIIEKKKRTFFAGARLLVTFFAGVALALALPARTFLGAGALGLVAAAFFAGGLATLLVVFALAVVALEGGLTTLEAGLF